MEESIYQQIINLVKEKFLYYDDFIFGMIVASFIWLIYHRFIGLKYVKKSYELRLEAQRETIKSLKLLVYERLDKVTTPEDLKKGIFSKIKKSFNIK